MLQQLAQHKIFSTLDFTVAYYQFTLREEDKYKMTVFFPGKEKFEWNVLPMGLKKAPAYMMRYMYKLFKDFSFIYVYTDYLTIASNNIDEHIQHIKMVFDRIEKGGMSLKQTNANLW